MTAQFKTFNISLDLYNELLQRPFITTYENLGETAPNLHKHENCTMPGIYLHSKHRQCPDWKHPEILRYQKSRYSSSNIPNGQRTSCCSALLQCALFRWNVCISRPAKPFQRVRCSSIVLKTYRIDVRVFSAKEWCIWMLSEGNLSCVVLSLRMVVYWIFYCCYESFIEGRSSLRGCPLWNECVLEWEIHFIYIFLWVFTKRMLIVKWYSNVDNGSVIELF